MLSLYVYGSSVGALLLFSCRFLTIYPCHTRVTSSLPCFKRSSQVCYDFTAFCVPTHDLRAFDDDFVWYSVIHSPWMPYGFFHATRISFSGTLYSVKCAFSSQRVRARLPEWHSLTSAGINFFIQASHSTSLLPLLIFGKVAHVHFMPQFPAYFSLSGTQF